MIGELQIQHVTADDLQLELEGFAVPPRSGVELLRDGDVLCVKLRPQGLAVHKIRAPKAKPPAKPAHVPAAQLHAASGAEETAKLGGVSSSEPSSSEPSSSSSEPDSSSSESSESSSSSEEEAEPGAGARTPAGALGVTGDQYATPAPPAPAARDGRTPKVRCGAILCSLAGQ